MIVGVSRTASETECRGAVKASLAQHIAEHPLPSTG
jgi:hypothetical protein